MRRKIMFIKYCFSVLCKYLHWICTEIEFGRFHPIHTWICILHYIDIHMHAYISFIGLNFNLCSWMRMWQIRSMRMKNLLFSESNVIRGNDIKR